MIDKHDDPWKIVDDLQSRNRDKEIDEVERDVAETIKELRAARRGRTLPDWQAAEAAPPGR